MDVYIGQLCSAMGLRDMCKTNMFTPLSGGRYLITGKDCPAQCGHNDFDHVDGDKTGGPGCFVIVSGEEEVKLWISDGSQKNVTESVRRKLKMAKVSRMYKITIPPRSVFVGHGYVQHAGAEWEGTHSIRYHMYFVPKGHPLKDNVSFAYGASFKKNTDESDDSSEDDKALPVPDVEDDDDGGIDEPEFPSDSQHTSHEEDPKDKDFLASKPVFPG